MNSVATGAKRKEAVPIRLSSKEKAEGKVNPMRDPRSDSETMPK